MSEPLLDDVTRELRELLARRPTIRFELGTLDAWNLVAVLQLALRHPRIGGAPLATAEMVKNALVAEIATTPALAELAALGDDPAYDRRDHD